MNIPASKAFVKKLRGPNSGSTKYLNLSPRVIFRLNGGGWNGMLGCGFC